MKMEALQIIILLAQGLIASMMSANRQAVNNLHGKIQDAKEIDRINHEAISRRLDDLIARVDR